MKVEPWERPYIRRYTLIFGVVGIGGMAAGILVELLFHWFGWGGRTASVTSVIPWMIGGMILIPSAFHAGVERHRQNQENGQKPDENPKSRVRPRILAEVVFFPPPAGRAKPPVELSSGKYMPHFVVGPFDPTRLARPDDDYLGVVFLSGPDAIEADKPVEVMLGLLYDQVDYSKLISGTEFTIREGGKSVGRGRVIRGLD